MDNYKVYMHTSPSGKRYIGVTKQNVKRRWRHGNGYKSNTYFWKAIKKYTWENIKSEVVAEGLTIEQAEKMERALIKEYKSNNGEFGYNLDCGGLLRREVSESTRKKLSEKSKGRGNSGWNQTEESKLLRAIPVEKYDVNKNLIATYESIRRAANSVNGNTSSIVACCKKKIKTHKGYFWKYKSDEAEIDTCKNFNSRGKKVIQYSIDGIKIREYMSSRQAGKEIKETQGLTCVNPHCAIGMCCLGTAKIAYGFKWRYA